jgi:hypothetical protein
MTIHRQLIEDVAWCWWTRPRATRIAETLYVGGITSDGAVFAATVDLAGGQATRHVLARLEPDDHNNPAVVATAGKRLLAFYSRHDADDALRWRRSKRPLDLSEWEPERTLSFGGITTYAQAHAAGDEVHLFTRVGDTSWAYVASPDWGETWSDPLTFIAVETDQETYMPTALLADGRTLRVAIAGHPKNYEDRPWHRIAAALVDLVTGAVTLPGSSSEIANVRTGVGLPLTGAQLELVYDAGPGRTLNVFDVGSGDDFEIAFASKRETDVATMDARYHVAARRGEAWMVEDIAPAGDIFGYIDAGFYVGGVAFPHGSTGVVFVSREHDGIWHLERWRRRADGPWEAQTVTEPSAARIVRPWPVQNPTAELEVVALLLERYGDDYMQTLSHLIGGAVAYDRR